MGASIRATLDEVNGACPGDELLPAARLVTTHAITVDATGELVWPWVAQIGQGRGGFYSYTWLENLMGCRMKNATRVHPEWQQVAVGDEIALHPRATPLRVALVEPERHLVLQSQAGLEWTWAFCLHERGTETRLLVRTRVKWTRFLTGLIARPVMGPGHYVMESRMLNTIRERVAANSG